MRKIEGMEQIRTAVPYSLGELLQLGSMSDARLLAGASFLQNAVSRPNVVEASNLLDWADSGDFLISSGYAFRNQVPLLVAQLEGLKHCGIAALCLKAGRTGQDLPDEVVQEAERLDLPLIELPMTAVFSNIVQESMEEILSKQMILFHEVQDKTQQLLNAMCAADHPENSLRVVENVLNNPVVIIDNENELIMTAKSRELLEDNTQEMLIRQLYKNTAQQSVLLRGDGAPRNVPVHVFEEGPDDGIRIVLLEYYSPLQPLDWLVLRQTGYSLRLQMKNALTVKKIRRKYKQQFVDDLLCGRFGDAVTICVTAQTDGYTLNMQSKYRVAAMNLNLPHTEQEFSEKDASIIRYVIRNLDANILFDVRQGKLILVMEDGRDWSQTLQSLSLLAEKLNYIMAKGEMNFCISGPCSLLDLPAGYQQVMRISHISQRCGLRKQVVTSEDLGILYLLSMIPEGQDIQKYRDKFLGPLQEYDIHHRSDLFQTVRIYLEADCNKQATAGLLHTHYNTVVYRISRAEELLGLSISDPETQLQLRIAFKLDMIR